MQTNELKKGDYILLRNGWYARIEDNRKGNTRLATVWGFETEMGSVYSHDIVKKIIPLAKGAQPERDVVYRLLFKQIADLEGVGAVQEVAVSHNAAQAKLQGVVRDFLG